VNTFKISSAFQIGLQAAGVNPAMVLRKSGLPLTLWNSGKGMVTTEQFFAIW
jgi:hypothetical protein